VKAALAGFSSLGLAKAIDGPRMNRCILLAFFQLMLFLQVQKTSQFNSSQLKLSGRQVPSTTSSLLPLKIKLVQSYLLTCLVETHTHLTTAGQISFWHQLRLSSQQNPDFARGYQLARTVCESGG
jgi:hypothetical protein